jgi:phosphatidate phosphatase APP1
MGKRVPILLSFYGLSNGTQNVFFGKLAHSPVRDLSFRAYSWITNVKTIIGLYRSTPIAFVNFEMIFDHGTVFGQTDVSGGFWCEADLHDRQTKLIEIRLIDSGESVQLTEDLYPNRIHPVEGHTIVVSDLDDTLIHSFIKNKFRQVRTLLFTSVEKRKAVKDMAHLIKRFALGGAHCFYLSNSEQNLYPMLYRFLTINEFPPGPLFLKQYKRVRQLVIRKKHSHKINMLGKLMELFPNKKFILIGDNTQRDLTIYLQIARTFPERIRYIIIRKVRKRKKFIPLITESTAWLKEHNIGFYYEHEYPHDLPVEI